MRTALEAWLRTDPFHNPDAPLAPMKMAEYVDEQKQEAERRQVEAAELLTSARHASDTSDSYVLLTVLYASVLFFAGIGGTLRSIRFRIALLVIATIQLLFPLAALLRLPVY